jgi:hypothetical protein
MALKKELKIGDEMVFDLSNMAADAKKEISIILLHVSPTGRRLEFKLTAHPSIRFKFFHQATVPERL